MKKTVNSKKIEIDGIIFQSNLEGFCYKQLKSSGLEFKYEPYSYVLLNKFKPKNLIRCLKIGDIVKHKDKPFVNQQVRDIVYTPDFVLEIGGDIIIIEVKGRANERYPIIRKLFFDLMSKDLARRYYFFEPHNQVEVIEMINLITSLNMINLQAIKMSMSLIEGNITSKDFKLLKSFIDDRKFDNAIELIESVIKIVSSKKDREDGDSMTIVNLTRLLADVKEYYSQIIGEEEEWD